MRKQLFLRFLTLAMVWLSVHGIANAIPTTCDVTLDSQSDKEVTLISTAMANKGKEAETLAVKQAFYGLIDRGIENLNSGQPILASPSKEFNYTFYKEGKYLKYLIGNPIKIDETKMGANKSVSVKVIINVARLKADLQANRLSISPAWQDKNEVHPTVALNPTIVVVPYIKSDGDRSFAGMKELIDNNPAVKNAVNTVCSQFASHGYKTRDFTTMLANSMTDDVITEGTQTDARTMVIQQLPGDIVVTVDLDLFNDNGKGSCTLTVDAVERQTAGKLCSATYNSGQYMTTDFVALSNHALKKIEKTFFDQMQDAFNRLIENGREMKLEFLLGESVTDWNFDLESPLSGDDFKESLEEWLRSAANHGIYDMSQHTDKFIGASINIPLWDADRDRSYSINNFNSALKKFLKSQLGDAYNANVASMGQKLIITIE